MLLNKIILVGIFLICIPVISAWNTAGELYDNETLNVGFNPVLNESEANNPYPYGLYPEFMDDPILKPSLSSLDPLTMCTTYTIYKQIWDGSNYVQIDTCHISIDDCVDLQYNSITNMYELPDTWAEHVSNGFLVKKYFQELINSDSEYCSEWNSSDSEFPDVFYSYIGVDVNTGTNYTAYMYTSVSDDDIETLTTEKIPDYGDYGLDTDGQGSDAGTGGIYQGLNIYGADKDGMASGTMGMFKQLFYILIPILFILCAFKFIGKVVN
jgi:hypothetical protein